MCQHSLYSPNLNTFVLPINNSKMAEYYPLASEASRGVYWNQAQKNYIHQTWIPLFYQLITQKWPNIIQYSAKWFSILALRSNTSPSNHHFFASLTIWLRLQRFAIHLDSKSWSWTPLHLNLAWVIKILERKFDKVILDIPVVKHQQLNRV